MMICRVHLSTDLLFSKFHLHGSMVIKIINTMEFTQIISETRGEQSKIYPRKTSTAIEVSFAVSLTLPHFSASTLHLSKAQISYLPSH